jgi:hypothetical protein
VTLPTKTPAIGPCPRVPATITPATTSRAVSAIMCAACVRDAGDELERGVKALRLELVHLVTDLGLEVALVREERIAARFPDEDFVAVDDDELSVAASCERLCEGQSLVSGFRAVGRPDDGLEHHSLLSTACLRGADRPGREANGHRGFA